MKDTNLPEQEHTDARSFALAYLGAQGHKQGLNF